MKFGKLDYAMFLMFIFYAVCSLAIPVVLVEIAEELDFSLTAGGMGKGGFLQMGRAIPMVASMLFCSAFATRFGIRKVLGLAACLMTVGILSAALAHSYWMLLGVLVIAGLGEGIIEGLGTPFVEKLHLRDEPGRYINFTHGFWSIGIFAGVPLLGGLLALHVSWRIVLTLLGAFGLIPLVMFFAFKPNNPDVPDGSRSFEWSRNFSAMGAILRRGEFWLFVAMMIFAAGGEFGITFWCSSLLRVDLGASPFVGSLAAAVFSLGMILGRTGTAMFVRQKQLPVWVMIVGIGGALVSLLIPLVGSIGAMMVVLFFCGIGSAPFWPSLQSYCVDRLPELDSTAIFILLSCAGVPGCGIFAALMGALGDIFSLHKALLLVPVCYTLMTLLVALDYWAFGGKKAMRSRQVQ